MSASTPTVPDPEFIRRICASSRAACPFAAHNRSCRSYFFSLSDGTCSKGGVCSLTIADIMDKPASGGSCVCRMWMKAQFLRTCVSWKASAFKALDVQQAPSRVKKASALSRTPEPGKLKYGERTSTSLRWGDVSGAAD